MCYVRYSTLGLLKNEHLGQLFYETRVGTFEHKNNGKISKDWVHF